MCVIAPNTLAAAKCLPKKLAGGARHYANRIMSICKLDAKSREEAQMCKVNVLICNVCISVIKISCISVYQSVASKRAKHKKNSW